MNTNLKKVSAENALSMIASHVFYLELLALPMAPITTRNQSKKKNRERSSFVFYTFHQSIHYFHGMPHFITMLDHRYNQINKSILLFAAIGIVYNLFSKHVHLIIL